MPDTDRLRAILDAERKIQDTTESRCINLGEQIIERMEDALALWKAPDPDRAADRKRGLLHLGDLGTMIAEYEEAWKQRAMRSLGGAPQPSEHFTREDRQQITGDKIIGLRNSTTRPDD